MCNLIRRWSIVEIVLAFAACLSPSRGNAQPPVPKDDKPIDFTMPLELGEYYVKPVQPAKDPKTGFIVGGKNATTLIRDLKEINGRTIAQLETDMRPNAGTDVSSGRGFLGRDEKLLNVLVADNRYVVDELGLTHQELAKHLHALGTIGFWQGEHYKLELFKFGPEFVYHGRRFKVSVATTAGAQQSPFRDGTQCGSDARVENVETGKKLSYSLLVPYMIERYGFYEGKGTPFRVDPREVVAVLDFLKPKAKKP
jgi:hypothetical protein